MSRAGKKRRCAADIPLKPEVVQTAEDAMRQRRHTVVYQRCLFAARRNCPPGEVIGAQIAQNIMDQIARQMAERQSRIVIPR